MASDRWGWPGRPANAPIRLFRSRECPKMADPHESLENLLSQSDPVLAPRRGDLLRGRILAVDTEGLIVDLGKKRDGGVPHSDLPGLPPEEANLAAGDEGVGGG